ncbi:MAG TPA: ABC transporter permease [Solirubrobacteraceae bacterium]|nr:ABC transporter permease [Solirubrobacteraceae bacterium]
MTTEEIELRDVPGPSALGGGWRRSLDLLYLIAVTNFKKTYFGTLLGYVWSLARPLMVFGVLLVVFTKVFHLSRHVPHYPVFLLMDVVLFGFFQEATLGSVGSIVGHESIVRKTQFPRAVIPLSVVCTSLFNLSLNLVAVFAFVIGFGVAFSWTWALIAVVVLALFIISAAVAMIVSVLYPRFRDVAIIWTVMSTALFYGTPALYPIWVLHPAIRNVIALNPLAPIFELAQRWVTYPKTPWPWAPAAGGPWRFAVAVAIYATVCLLALWLFNREAPRIAEEL